MIAMDIITTDESSRSFLKNYLSIMYPREKEKDLVLVTTYVITSQIYMRDYLRVAKYASDPNIKIIILRDEEDNYLMTESANYSGLMALSNVASHNSADLGSLMDTYKLITNSDKKDETARAIYNFHYKEQTMSYLKKELDRVPRGSSLEKWLDECRKLNLEGTDEEITSSVKKWRPELNREFKDKYLKGIFVNIFEIIYGIAWDVNLHLVEITKKLAEAKAIDVFVIYDREESWVQSKLQKAKVPWLAVPKSALKTATLEIVIDNISKEEFKAKCGIIAKKYIQISEFPKIIKPDLFNNYKPKLQPPLP